LVRRVIVKALVPEHRQAEGRQVQRDRQHLQFQLLLKGVPQAFGNGCDQIATRNRERDAGEMRDLQNGFSGVAFLRQQRVNYALAFVLVKHRDVISLGVLPQRNFSAQRRMVLAGQTNIFFFPQLF